LERFNQIYFEAGMLIDCSKRMKAPKNVQSLPQALLIGLLIFISGATIASAQTSQGSISGEVRDARGALVPKASVVITSLDTGVEFKTLTNGSGFYNVLSLVAGTYRIEVMAKGFQKVVVDKVLVSAAEAVQVNVQLVVGSENVSVTVTSQTDLLSTTSDVSATVDHEVVENLPYPERSSLGAALLVPGANGDSLIPGGIQTENPGIATGAVNPGASIQVGGSVAGTTALLVDGSDVMQASVPRAGLNLSGRIVQETTVITSGLSAKYGRTSAGAIIQQSKGGTSSYHGGITYRHTDPFFNAPPNNGTNIKNNVHENFYGFYVGGPIFLPRIYPRKDKTFFFVGVEPARLRQSVAVRGTFMTPETLAGHFYNSIDILNTSVLKANGYAAALAAPRVGATIGTNGMSSSLYSGELLTPQPSGACPGATTTVGFPCGGSSGANIALNGPLSDCAAVYGVSPNPGATQCVDDMAPQLAGNPFAQFVLSHMPTPPNPGPYMNFDHPDGSYETDGTNAAYSRGVNDTDNRYSIRIDHQFNNSNSVFVRYTVIPIIGVRFFAVDPSNPIGQIPTDASHAHDIAFGYTHILSNDIVNNFHYSLMRNNQQRTAPPATLGTDYAAKYGLTSANSGYGFPSLGTFSTNGINYTIQPGASGSTQLDQNFIVGDDVNWTHGGHLFQFGVDIRWIQSNQYDFSGSTGGKYTFVPAYTSGAKGGGSAVASFIFGIPATFSNTPVPTPAYYRWKYYAGYFQDDWRATPRLTLNLGLRYAVETPRAEKFNNQAFVIPGVTGQTANGSVANAAFCFSGACGTGKGLWPTNYWGLEPRIGISYAATERTTIRASYALTRMPLSGYEASPDPNLNVPGQTISYNSGGINPNAYTDYISNPIATPVSAFAALGGSRGPFFTSTGFTPVFVSQSNAVPYIQTYSLSFQYQPLQKTIVQATYQGTKGTHLVGNFVAQNTPPLSTVISAVQQGLYLGGQKPNMYGIVNPGTTSPIQESAAQSLAPYQSFFNQSLTQIYPRDGILEYNALYLSLNQRATNNVTFIASYAWSKSLDDVPNLNAGTTFASTNISGVQNPFDRRGDYSVSATDQASRFKAGYNAVLPFGINQRFRTGNGFIDRLVGDISTSGITTWADGLPNFVSFGTAGNFYSISPGGGGGFNGYPNCSPSTGAVPYCTTAALPSGYTLRPNIVKGIPLINPNFKKNPYNSLAGPITSFLNPAAFGCFTPQGSTILTCQAPGTPGNPQLGNAPRFLSNARSPRQFTYDMRFVKGFTIKNDYRLNVNVALNDAFNHQVFNGISTHTLAGSTVVSNAGVVGSTESASFGNLIGTNFARIIRVGAEFSF
jgi:hypothetical protein